MFYGSLFINLHYTVRNRGDYVDIGLGPFRRRLDSSSRCIWSTIFCFRHRMRCSLDGRYHRRSFGWAHHWAGACMSLFPSAAPPFIPCTPFPDAFNIALRCALHRRYHRRVADGFDFFTHTWVRAIWLVLSAVPMRAGLRGRRGRGFGDGSCRYL